MFIAVHWCEQSGLFRNNGQGMRGPGGGSNASCSPVMHHSVVDKVTTQEVRRETISKDSSASRPTFRTFSNVRENGHNFVELFVRCFTENLNSKPNEMFSSLCKEIKVHRNSYLSSVEISGEVTTVTLGPR